MKKIFTNLTFWVLTAITAGALLGHFAPEKAIEFKWLGTRFIDIVKLFINPIIFLTISLGISGMGDLKKVGKVGLKALIYFEVVTTFALLAGILVANIIQPGAGVSTGNLEGADLSEYTTKSAEFSWLKFLKENLTIQVLIFSILFGVVLSKLKQKVVITNFLNRISKYVFKALHWVMFFAPLGAFGGMAFTIGKYGIKTLFPLGKLMVSVYATMAIFVFVVLYLILKYYKISIFKFLKYIREELLPQRPHYPH
jgi:aerobic C4-dicarboxylate transport protein